jgi:hypothetical protein
LPGASLLDPTETNDDLAFQLSIRARLTRNNCPPRQSTDFYLDFTLTSIINGSPQVPAKEKKITFDYYGGLRRT